MALVIQLVVMAAMGTACALIAQNRGRSAVGWFFVGLLAGCIGLILVLVLPDLKVQEERERRLADENRRLREKLKKDRMVADERHAEIQRRVGAHDVALGVDTSVPATAALPGGVPPIDARPASSESANALRGTAWYWAQGLNRQGPLDFATLQGLWQEGRVTTETLVWCKGMPKWIALRDVPGLEETLDA
jgi:GYF domain 2